MEAVFCIPMTTSKTIKPGKGEYLGTPLWGEHTKFFGVVIFWVFPFPASFGGKTVVLEMDISVDRDTCTI